MTSLRRLVISSAALLVVWTPASAQEVPAAHFHHIHINATDPSAAIDFYTKHFDCEKQSFAGLTDAVWAQKSWLLFSKAATPPPSEILSTIWHFGWGAEDMPKEYQRQLSLGAKFETPLTDISKLANYQGFYYAYVDGPDHALIELNTAAHHRFGHLHLLSADPIAAGEWYERHFGIQRRGPAKPSREPRFYEGYQVGPASSLMVDNVNIIIYPVGYATKAWPKLWEGRTSFESTKGRVVDHIGLSVNDLDATLKRLRDAGVRITEEPKTIAGGKFKYAFIEGPDRIRIELVEDHTKE